MFAEVARDGRFRSGRLQAGVFRFLSRSLALTHEGPQTLGEVAPFPLPLRNSAHPLPVHTNYFAP
jgi:hypothetical protein